MKRKLLSVIAACLLAAVCCPLARAQTETQTPEPDANSRVDFSVKAHLPDNQIDKDQSYFDLRVEPGQNQMLQVRVYNNASAPLTVDIELNTASTNPGGVLDYGRANIRDESMKIAISDLAYIPEPKLTIPPNDSRVAVIGITMPNERFDGVLLGGIRVKKSADENAAASIEEGSTGIINEFAYVIAVKLTETDTEVAPELHLKKIEPSLVNFKTAVVATVQNSEACIIKNVDFHARVYKSGSSEPLREARQDGVDMAPNSVFDYAIDWENTQIKPGDYTLHLTATHGEKVWEWNEPFTIAGDTAGEVNEGAIDLETSWFSGAVLYIACGAAILLLIIVIIYIAARKRRRASAR